MNNTKVGELGGWLFIVLLVLFLLFKGFMWVRHEVAVSILEGVRPGTRPGSDCFYYINADNELKERNNAECLMLEKLNYEVYEGINKAVDEEQAKY